MDDFKLGLAVGTILGAVEATFLIVVLNIVIETIIQKDCWFCDWYYYNGWIDVVVQQW